MGILFDTVPVSADFNPKAPLDNTLYLGDRKVISWGPRVQREEDPTNCVPPEEGEAPDFYTVFSHGEDNRAKMIADVATEGEAIQLVRVCFPGILLTEQLIDEPAAMANEDAAIFMHSVREQIASANAALDTFEPRD